MMEKELTPTDIPGATGDLEASAKLSPQHREDLQRLRGRVRRFLDEQIDDPSVHVDVTLDDEGWYEFQGQVDDSGTKAALFGMVPSKHGAQRIVDRVHIGRLSSTRH